MRRMFSKNQLENQTEELLASGNLPSVKADEIIENMSGYSVNLLTPAGYTIENIYAGAVKNGNKLTLVYSFNITKTDADANVSPYPIQFVVPSSIMSKLYTTNVGGNPILDTKEVKVFNALATGVQLPLWLEKGTTTLNLQLYTVNLVVDTKYYVRYEVTFLLSDNLIP